LQGQGDPIVLIDGGKLDSRMWDDQFARYAKHYRVHRYDVRGFEGSLRSAEQIDSDADDLAALMDYLAMPRAHLVGLSLGGLIALDFAVTRPKRVLSMVLDGAGLSGYEKDAGPARIQDAAVADSRLDVDPFAVRHPDQFHHPPSTLRIGVQLSPNLAVSHLVQGPTQGLFQVPVTNWRRPAASSKRIMTGIWSKIDCGIGFRCLNSSSAIFRSVTSWAMPRARPPRDARDWPIDCPFISRRR
jgi:pimeloyl-ACP methyl ester carboxylesterase